jgi:hypothetical protein
MTNTALYTRITTLPKSIQDELFNYMEFLIQKKKTEKIKIHPKAGCMQGVFEMSNDFNETPEDFNEYIK